MGGFGGKMGLRDGVRRGDDQGPMRERPDRHFRYDRPRGPSTASPSAIANGNFAQDDKTFG